MVSEEVFRLELGEGRPPAWWSEARLFSRRSVFDDVGCEGIERPIASAPPVFVTVSCRSRSAWRTDKVSSTLSGPGVFSPSRDIIVATPARIAVSETAAAPSVGGEEGDGTPTNLRTEAGSRPEALASLDEAWFPGETAASCVGFDVSEEP